MNPTQATTHVVLHYLKANPHVSLEELVAMTRGVRQAFSGPAQRSCQPSRNRALGRVPKKDPFAGKLVCGLPATKVVARLKELGSVNALSKDLGVPRTTLRRHLAKLE